MSQTEKQIGDDLMMAAINCGHTITEDELTLRRDTKRPGCSLTQLRERVLAAHHAAQASAPVAAMPKDTPESMAESNARFAIDGAIQYGREDRNKPPSDDHWLMEYWLIGQQLRELGKTGWDNRTPLAPSEKATLAAPQQHAQAAQPTTQEIRVVASSPEIPDSLNAQAALSEVLASCLAKGWVTQEGAAAIPAARQPTPATGHNKHCGYPDCCQPAPDDLIGLAVSVDVSTGDDDATHRYFGKVDAVQECASEKGGIILLVQEPKPNFSAPVATAVQGEADVAFAQFCDREGYPSDGPFDAALRKAFDAGRAAQPPADAAPADRQWSDEHGDHTLGKLPPMKVMFDASAAVPIPAVGDGLAPQASKGAVPAGWQIVPKEPTPEMLAHVDNAVPDCFSIGDEYRAMLAAAPSPAQAQPVADAVPMDARHLFEAWAKERGFKLDIGPDGKTYISGYTQSVWEPWEAAITALAGKPADAKGSAT